MAIFLPDHGITTFNQIMSDMQQEEEKMTENPQTEQPTNEAVESSEIGGSEINSLEAELAASKDKYLRLLSDFENYKRRSDREKTDLIKYAGSDIITSMLTILDDFERAMKAITQDANSPAPLVEGVELIYNKFKNTLFARGLSEIPSALGNDMDTDYHDAITNIQAPHEDLRGKVIEEIQKGYTLNGKVIRHTKVIIGM
jgi:molecular chaperone GrpE